MAEVNAVTTRERAGDVPAFRRIEADLRARIDDGRWSAGHLIPSRRTLAKEYGVDLLTLQRAIATLVDDGLLRAEDRRGTFVASAGSPRSSIVADIESPSPLASKHPATLAIVCGWPANFPRYPDHPNIFSYYSMSDAVEQAYVSYGCGHTRYYYLESRGRDADPDVLKREVDAILADKPDALAFVVIDDDIADRLAGMTPPDLPTVFVMVERSHPGALAVSTDHLMGGYEAALHLIESGYEKLAFYSPVDAHWSDEREEGIRKALARSGGRVTLTVVEPKYKLPTRLLEWEERSREWARDHVTAEIAGMGVVGVNDYVAGGISIAASGLGLTAGVDYGLIGFDNVTAGKALGLSTMCYPLAEMGREACRMLVETLNGRPCAQRSVVRFKLLARGSSQPMQTRQ
ncbi:MAG TPA: substrate-binding domain-containing protein [Capsulimonadaceae bacterium]|jgi:DNA-binding LacI/PurR family transcriptional regulator/DNA-binding transcriptional regulator YhcF (GntR family)